MGAGKNLSVKTGVKILDETDRDIAKLICAGESRIGIAIMIGRSKQFVTVRILSWLRYYEVKTLTDLSIIFARMGLFKTSNCPTKRPPAVYDNNQYNA